VPVISPLLANIYLDLLDVLMAGRGYRMVRYADAPGSRRRAGLAGACFVILCRTPEEADAALAEVRAWVGENGLTLHPQKKHVGNCRTPGEEFEFVMPKACVPHDDYRFEVGRRFVRKKSLNKLKDSIREKTGRCRWKSLAHVITDLAQIIERTGDGGDRARGDLRAMSGPAVATARRIGGAHGLPRNAPGLDRYRAAVAHPLSASCPHGTVTIVMFRH
jgi:hypothetical protein